MLTTAIPYLPLGKYGRSHELRRELARFVTHAELHPGSAQALYDWATAFTNTEAIPPYLVSDTPHLPIALYGRAEPLRAELIRLIAYYFTFVNDGGGVEDADTALPTWWGLAWEAVFAGLIAAGAVAPEPPEEP